VVELSEHPVEQMPLGGGVPVAGAVAAIRSWKSSAASQPSGEALAEIEWGLLVRQTFPDLRGLLLPVPGERASRPGVHADRAAGPGSLDWVAVAIRGEGLR
jgi:hypothetical protein